MAQIEYSGLEIKGLAACVPKGIVKNDKAYGPYDPDKWDKYVRSIGVYERRFATQDVCTSDLCFEAATRLMKDGNIDPASIDLLVVVTESPDYLVPSTSGLLQHRLGLSTDIIAHDINSGCSGYIYGLSMVYAWLTGARLKRALLLVGDTCSKSVSVNDLATGIIFGDAGSATLIDRTDSDRKTWISLNVDGANAKALMVKAGGARHRSTLETIKEIEYEDGSIRSDEDLIMDGGAVFNFVVKRVPRDIHSLLAFAGMEVDDVKYFVFHNANKIIVDYLTRKLRVSREYTLDSLEHFGNSSAGTLPTTLATRMPEARSPGDRFLLSGFGIGLSWGSCILDLDQCRVSELIER